MRKIKGSPQPFGVDIKGKNINFAVQVAKGKTCELLLYKRGKEVPEYQFDMPEEEGVGEVRFLSVEGLKADRYGIFSLLQLPKGLRYSHDMR